MSQAKRVKFQGDPSQDGSTTRIPKRGSSRGTSIASSNKNKKDDNLLEELDGLFAQEYKKPQRSIVDSLNTSKKNTPDNSSSKPNKNEADDLNDQILMKKLEDLQRATQNDNMLPKANNRSSSLPINKSNKRGSGRLEKPEVLLNDQAPEQTLNVKPQPKKEKAKDKQKQQQEYAQILPQPSIPIIKPQPQKLTKQQKKKVQKEKKQESATKTQHDKKAEAQAKDKPAAQQNAPSTSAAAGNKSQAPNEAAHPEQPSDTVSAPAAKPEEQKTKKSKKKQQN